MESKLLRGTEIPIHCRHRKEDLTMNVESLIFKSKRSLKRKCAAQKIQYPGQGNKRRELVQDKLRDPVQSYISRGGSISTEGKSSAPVEFQLSWIMKGSAKFEAVLAKMYSEKIDFFSLPG